MAIRILVKGKLPGKRIFLGTCGHCETQARALLEDLKASSDRNDTIYSGPCPLCKETIHFDSTTDYEELPDVPTKPTYREPESNRLEFGGQSRDTGGHPRLP